MDWVLPVDRHDNVEPLVRSSEILGWEGWLQRLSSRTAETVGMCEQAGRAGAVSVGHSHHAIGEALADLEPFDQRQGLVFHRDQDADAAHAALPEARRRG